MIATATAHRRILAIDPGPERSAFVGLSLRTGKLLDFGIRENEDLIAHLFTLRAEYDQLAIEMIACYGMPVGAEVFNTCVWIGRFAQAWGAHWSKVYRREVKMTLCGNMRAKDPNVRQALIDRYGPGKEQAVGRKASPGPLYGVSKDVWAALGVAVTVADRELEGRLESYEA